MDGEGPNAQPISMSRIFILILYSIQLKKSTVFAKKKEKL
mgnify:CR=1